MNRIKVALAEKQKPIDGWLNRWGNQKTRYQDGVPINRNHQLLN